MSTGKKSMGEKRGRYEYEDIFKDSECSEDTSSRGSNESEDEGTEAECSEDSPVCSEDGADDEDDRGESPQEDNGDGGISVTIDTASLECPSCSKPLRPPIFQCPNGHITCSSCLDELQKKCPTCIHSSYDNRCIALEKVIEAMKVPCSSAKYGCKSMLPYSESLNHQGSCSIHLPCFCPVSTCSFSGPCQEFSTHFVDVHGYDLTELQYNVSTPVIFFNSDPFHLLVGPEDEHFLLRHDREHVLNTGEAFSIVCISPKDSTNAFEYEIIVMGPKNISLHLKASMTYIQKLAGSSPTDIVLLVPRDFGAMQVDVVIRKKD